MRQEYIYFASHIIVCGHLCKRIITMTYLLIDGDATWRQPQRTADLEKTPEVVTALKPAHWRPIFEVYIAQVHCMMPSMPPSEEAIPCL